MYGKSVFISRTWNLRLFRLCRYFKNIKGQRKNWTRVCKKKVELEEYFEKEYGEDEEVATEVLENKFEIYLDGHAVDDSKTLEIIEKEIS